MTLRFPRTLLASNWALRRGGTNDGHAQKATEPSIHGLSLWVAREPKDIATQLVIGESAVRLTHIPTGIAVVCQAGRSQHKNRSRAMALLKARLLAAEQEKQQSEQARARKLQVGSGDRSERIRTYNFPQGRVTDHRINLTLYQLQKIMDGDLEELLNALQQEYQTEQLAAEE